MPYPLALPVALSAIQALVKFRGRLDTILSLNETTSGLPFALPPTPAHHGPHIDPMMAFFSDEKNTAIITLRGLEADWRSLQPDPRAGHVQLALSKLMQAYYEANEITPLMLGPTDDEKRQQASKGPSKEMRLAYYVVESDRLSRNHAVTRVLLATADTLLEFGAENAHLFVSNPRTRSVIESLLTEFAVKHNWDDDSGAHIFKLLLGSTVIAALENPGMLPEKPAVQVLFAALSELRTQEGDDFVATLVTKAGFRSFVSSCLLLSAEQPGLLPETPVLKNALQAMLSAAGKDLSGLLDRPGALAGILEAGVAAAAEAALPIIDKTYGKDPLLAVVLKGTLASVQQSAANNGFFASLIDGKFLASLYRTSLQSVAANPEALADQADVAAHVAKLISACAGELARINTQHGLSAATLRPLAARALEVLAQEPEFTRGHGEFAAKVMGAALASTARAVRAGFTSDDLKDIAESIVQTAAGNIGLIKIDTRFQPVVAAFAQTLSSTELSTLANARGRKALFVGSLQVLVNNPQTWAKFEAKNLVNPIISATIKSLVTHAPGMHSGQSLSACYHEILEAVARQGRMIIEDKVGVPKLQKLLELALDRAEQAMGDSLDAKSLPSFMKEVVTRFLNSPIDLNQQPQLAQWLDQRIAAVA